MCLLWGLKPQVGVSVNIFKIPPNLTRIYRHIDYIDMDMSIHVALSGWMEIPMEIRGG